MNDRYRSKSSLFLMEQLIVIFIFAVCAAACVKIFAGSYIMAKSSGDLSRALLAAESGAECYKAVAGNAGDVARLMGGYAEGTGTGGVTVYYDEGWKACAQDGASYRMRFTDTVPPDASPSLKYSDITVEKVTGEEIIALTVAAGRRTS